MLNFPSSSLDGGVPGGVRETAAVHLLGDSAAVFDRTLQLVLTGPGLQPNVYYCRVFANFVEEFLQNYI